ncbi:xanthine/CO dehydrogenase XdhC/CoxF family maturation factor [Wenyingzhuangia heitensis]|uniref:Xanthine/CO dehydrogenase XdhC/CoxF family maturation factor n=1 Tax=Wenyingzhuangia heitensis TaxID=1487859 RepID=A0ABX0U588_9FLAO|nr:XdhC/CoxI family protein [Wenyingzhuangia heitensis]NIJ44025.1 xanthine/CO dehydrogenase XdhC/CoxF family maturation factor [Wenyingzhuangia heitensis]
MTHEFKQIITAYSQAKSLSKSTVLATLVSVNGSSYRKEGVRMLIHQNQQIVGAVSGGCVEKEVVRQSESVFATGQSKLMSYDGRYRLGCEGTLYLLLEKLEIEDEVLVKIQESFVNRTSFELVTFYGDEFSEEGRTIIQFEDEEYPISNVKKGTDFFNCFRQKMEPIFQLYIIGIEHDANSLSQQASFLGWEVTVVNTGKILKSIDKFIGTKKIINLEEEKEIDLLIDDETAIVLMNHNYAKDLLFLKSIKNKRPVYIGLLGAKKRKEQLLNALIEEDLDVSEEFLALIHGPTGLDIGSVTPQEIAVSIVSEIILTIKKKSVKCL